MSEAFFVSYANKSNGSQNAQTKSSFKGLFIQIIATFAKKLKKYYLIKYGREITIEEIKKELKVTKEDILIAIDSVNNVESIENAATSENKDGKKLSIMEKISTGKNEEEIITNKLVIRELIEDLKDRDRQIILLRFFKEKTQTEVANMLGISQVQVSRIEKKVLSNMRKKLTSA